MCGWVWEVRGGGGGGGGGGAPPSKSASRRSSWLRPCAKEAKSLPLSKQHLFGRCLRYNRMTLYQWLCAKDYSNTIVNALELLRSRAKPSISWPNEKVGSWWRHQMETFSALLDFGGGNPPITRGLPSQGPVAWSSDVLFDLHLNKRFSKRPRRWWFETPSHSLWRHYNGAILSYHITIEYARYCRKARTKAEPGTDFELIADIFDLNEKKNYGMWHTWASKCLKSLATSLGSTACSGQQQRNHKSAASLACCEGKYYPANKLWNKYAIITWKRRFDVINTYLLLTMFAGHQWYGFIR